MEKPLWAHLCEWIKYDCTTDSAQTFFDYFALDIVVFYFKNQPVKWNDWANVVTDCGGGNAGRPLRGPVCFGHVTVFHGKKSLLCAVLEAKTSGPQWFTAKCVLFQSMLVTACFFPNAF